MAFGVEEGRLLRAFNSWNRTVRKFVEMYKMFTINNSKIKNVDLIEHLDT